MYLVLSMVWPTVWLAIKVTLRGSPPLLSCGLRFLVAGACFAGFRLATAGSLRLPRSTFKLVAVVCMGYFVLINAAIYLGETQISSGLAALLSSATPLLVALVAHRMLPEERLTWRRLAGIAVAIGGLGLVFHGGLTIESSLLSVLAMVAIGLAQIPYAYAQVLLRRDARTLPTSLVNAWGMLVAAVLVLGLSAAIEPHRLRLDVATLGSIAYLATLGTVLPFAGLLWLLKRSAASSVGLLGLVIPVIALFEGWLLLSEPLDWSLVVGAIVVVIGLLLSWLGGLKKRLESTPTNTGAVLQ